MAEASTSGSSTATKQPPLFNPPSPLSDSGDENVNGGAPGGSRRRTGNAGSSAVDGDGDVSMQGADGGEHGNGAPNQQQQPYGSYVDSEEDSDPDDPIVKTLPVFLTPNLSRSLALLQYPQRHSVHHTKHPLLPPSLRPDDNRPDTRTAAERVSARYKPRVGQLELSVPLEVAEGRLRHRYNEERAYELGKGQQDSDLGEGGSKGKAPQANGHGRNRSPVGYEEGASRPLQRMTIAGETVPDQTWYTCAVLKDNEVHLTPLTRTLQMRAHLSYLDRLDEIASTNSRRERIAAGASDDEAYSAGSDEDEGAGKSASALAAAKKKKQAAADKKAKEGENKAVQVKMEEAPDDGGKGGKSGDMKTARAAASLFGPAKAAQDEEWIDLPFHDPLAPDSDRIYEQLFANKHDKLEMLTHATQYLRL